MNRLTAAKPSWITVLAFAAGFFLTAELGRVVSLKGTSYVSFWLPAGLYMGILLVHHPRYWPIFIQAVLPVNLLFDLRHGTPLATTLGFYLANTTEAVIGAWLTRRFMAGQPRLQSLQDLYGLIAGSAVISTVAGAMGSNSRDMPPCRALYSIGCQCARCGVCMALPSLTIKLECRRLR